MPNPKINFTNAQSSKFLSNKDIGTSELYINKANNNPNTFLHFFPDTGLAIIVADYLKKKYTDNTTISDLTTLNGEFLLPQFVNNPSDSNNVFEITNLKGIGFLIGINEIGIGQGCPLEEIPAEIGNLINLESLNFGRAYELKIIPSEIGKLTKLKSICLWLTQVDKLPKEIGNLSNLESLKLSCNVPTKIPPEIGKLKKLKELDMHRIDNDAISVIPDEICNLTSLIYLDLRNNGLEKLPENIGNLKNLKVLNLFGNNLKYLPRSIEKMDCLNYINVYDNFKLSENYKNYLPRLLRKKLKTNK